MKYAFAFLIYFIANVAAAQQVVLDDSGYWRSNYRFMPDRIYPEAMREGGAKLLGRRFATIQRGIVERMEAAGIDHEAEDWHRHDMSHRKVASPTFAAAVAEKNMLAGRSCP